MSKERTRAARTSSGVRKKSKLRQHLKRLKIKLKRHQRYQSDPERKKDLTTTVGKGDNQRTIYLRRAYHWPTDGLQKEIDRTYQLMKEVGA